jgi:hypothetical protein
MLLVARPVIHHPLKEPLLQNDRRGGAGIYIGGHQGHKEADLRCARGEFPDEINE